MQIVSFSSSFIFAFAFFVMKKMEIGWPVAVVEGVLIPTHLSQRLCFVLYSSLSHTNTFMFPISHGCSGCHTTTGSKCVKIPRRE